ncbi:MAG TPA: hypothetical protein VNS58_13830 [Puia sp.]|nr:hypothetical protein [Puia sp.]
MKYLLILGVLCLTQRSQGQQRFHKYIIGDSVFCGIVFFVEDIDSLGRQHGLICAPGDQHAGIQWYNGNYVTTFAIQDHLYDKGNADTIIIVQKSGSYAATICNDYNPDSMCTRWYLPSRTELLLMYSNIANNKNLAIKKRGKFKNEGYWSSLEAGADSLPSFSPNERKAFIVDFLNGRTFPVNKSNNYRARAVREFRNYTALTP